MQNTLPATPSVRAPRGIVRLSNQRIDGWVSWTVTQNTFYEADTFRATFAESLLTTERDAAWFSALTEGFVEIFAGFPADPASFTDAELDSLIYGRIDLVDYDPVRHVVELTGRDLTSVFIDTKVSADYQNMTSSAVATKLAESHGLTPLVTATKETIGSYYLRDHVQISYDRSEWDLLTYLAAAEEFDCYVTGKALYFGPKPTGKAEPYVIRWEPANDERASPLANIQELDFSRNLTVARGVVVVVRSWNDRQKNGFTAYYPSKGKTTQAGKATPFGGTQIFSYVVPNKTQQQAFQIAQQRHREITSQEMKLRARLPGDNLLAGKTPIQVEGTSTKFDQLYYPMTITRQMSVTDGYTMTVEAKNQNPESVPLP